MNLLERTLAEAEDLVPDPKVRAELLERIVAAVPRREVIAQSLLVTFRKVLVDLVTNEYGNGGDVVAKVLVVRALEILGKLANDEGTST